MVAPRIAHGVKCALFETPRTALVGPNLAMVSPVTMASFHYFFPLLCGWTFWFSRKKLPGS